VSGALRLKSRRLPSLRVVSAAADAARHESFFKVHSCQRILQLWTFEEWDRLADAERPKGGKYMLPGVGIFHLRTPKDDDEAVDVTDVCKQATAAYWAERGLGPPD
jgi:hypothetical protein